MKVKTWRCSTAHCPVRHLALGHVESETLENLLAVVRCLYCWQPLTPDPITTLPLKQMDPN